MFRHDTTNNPRARAADTIREARRAYGESLAYAVAEDQDVADAVVTLGARRAARIFESTYTE